MAFKNNYISLKQVFKPSKKYKDIKEAVIKRLGINSEAYKEAMFSIEFKRCTRFHDLRRSKRVKMILVKGSNDRLYITNLYYKHKQLKDFFEAVDAAIEKYKKKYNVVMSDAKLVIRLDVRRYGRLPDRDNNRKTVRLEEKPSKKYRIRVYLGRK